MVMASNHLILCYPLLLLPSIFPSIRVFSNESAPYIRWPKYWSFSFSFNISPSNQYSGLISFKIDWFDILAVQGTLKILFQHHSLKASILWHSAFFMVQLSHPYMTTGKTIALTKWTFVGKVMSLLFSMLSIFVISYHWFKRKAPNARSESKFLSYLQKASANSQQQFLNIVQSDFFSIVFFKNLWKCQLLSHVRLFGTRWTVACQVPLSMKECQGGLPFTTQEIFLTEGSDPGLLHCRQILYHLSHQGSPSKVKKKKKKCRCV